MVLNHLEFIQSFIIQETLKTSCTMVFNVIIQALLGNYVLKSVTLKGGGHYWYIIILEKYWDFFIPFEPRGNLNKYPIFMHIGM